ncbi:hypothetical protein BLNAU_16136 [Blattamonas nauphoetae]|uniref:Uncharacterized protein n=1 Tax=Blattamonas nauphoetae TaxID=2049346 RepID=A0ABQ9XCD1_9EUKA|nr:hypothetical protein BLNAU_16136 [Blattamonas nauphoetae]
MENEQVIADRKRNRNHRKKTMWKDHLDYTHKLAAQFEEKRRDGEDLSTDSEGMRRIEQARLIDEKEKLLWGVYGEGELGDSELLLRAKMQAGRRSGRERTKSQERTDEAEEPENTARSNAKSQTGNKTERAMSSFVERQMQDAERRREIQKLLEKEKEEREQRIQNKEFETECKQRSKPTQNLSESELAEIRIKTQKASELRRQKLAQEKKERLEKEKKNMTFHPKINPSPSNTTPRPRSSIEDTVARLSAVKGPKRIRKTTPTKPKPKPQRPKTVSTQRERPSPRLSRKERERMIVECVERMEEDRIDRKIKEELRKEEMHSAECPFHPQLSPNTQRLAKLSETRQLNSTMQTFTSQHSNNTTPTHQRPLSKSQAQTLQRQRVLEMGEQRARKMWETEEERKRKKRMKELFAAIYLASSGKDGKSVDGFVLPVEVRDIVGRMGNDGKLRTEKQTTNKNGEETDRSCRPDSTGETFQNDTMHERTNLSERELQTTTKEDIGNDQKDEREQQTTLDEVTIETHSHHTPSSRSLSPPHTLHVTSSSSTSPSHASTHPNVVASHTHSSSISSYEMTTPIVSNAPSHIASPEPPHPAHSTTRLVEHPHTVPSSELNDESVDERTQRSQTDDDSLSADLGKFNQEALIFISHFLKSWIVNFVQQLQSHPDTSQTLTFHAFLKRCRAEKKRNDEKGIPTSNDVIMRPGQPLFEDDTRRREEIDRVLKRMRIVVERKGKGNDEQIELKQHEEEEGSERKKSEVFERLAANGKRIGMEMKTRHDSEKKREQQAAKRREEIFTLSHLQKRNEKSVEKSTADPALFERLSQRKEIVLKKDSEDDALANQTRMMDGFLKLLRSSSPVNTQKIEKKQRRTIKEKSYPEKMHDLFSRMAATPD